MEKRLWKAPFSFENTLFTLKMSLNKKDCHFYKQLLPHRKTLIRLKSVQTLEISDFNLEPNKSPTTFTASGLLRSNLELGTTIDFTPVVPRGDMVLSSFDIPETTLKTKSYYLSTTNAIRYDIFAKVSVSTI